MYICSIEREIHNHMRASQLLTLPIARTVGRRTDRVNSFQSIQSSPRSIPQRLPTTNGQINSVSLFLWRQRNLPRWLTVFPKTLITANFGFPCPSLYSSAPPLPCLSGANEILHPNDRGLNKWCVEKGMLALASTTFPSRSIFFVF